MALSERRYRRLDLIVRYRPIADIKGSCQPDSMIRPSTLLLCVMAATISASTERQKPMDAEKIQFVSGLLDAHWEYPTFLPDRKSGPEFMTFKLTEEKWQRVYSDPANDTMYRYPDEEKCFRIIGKGYLTRRPPDIMRNWEGRQFVFVKIEKLEPISTAECELRSKINNR